MPNLSDKEVQELLNNPNVNEKFKQQIRDARGVPEEEPRHLFLIEDWIPVNGDSKQYFILGLIVLAVLFWLTL